MLNDTKVRSAKSREKAFKLSDERGLFLLVTLTGSRLWRLKYRLNGREKLISLGAYPDVTLKRAREKRDAARRLIADGIDPSAQRKAERAALAQSFEGVAKEWLELQTKSLAPETISILSARLDGGLYPYIGSRPISAITAQELLGALRRIEARGRHETAHRVRALAGRVFRYAVATGRAHHDVAADLKGALAPVKAKHFASVTDPARVGELMRAIHGYSGHPVTALALKLAPLVFVRPGELRAAEWPEFDLENAEWRIPGERMKMGEPHLVPLSRQALAILRELQPLARGGKYLFPSLRTRDRPMSDNTINAALRRMGYTSEEQTGHGFRSMASTLLNEQGFPPDVIELQLAHTERNKVRAAYNKAQRLPERRKMMQAWADHLDGLRAGGNVVPLRRRARSA
ncbi:MAG TPA: integrase arm-type DNA-binding domain-containing protein [Steroidobacteraceae bacterium]|jgi:integrase|nr:integrase arm-type DNA-binding domain-containing protein [Steroidobacteraceae bacterium]